MVESRLRSKHDSLRSSKFDGTQGLKGVNQYEDIKKSTLSSPLPVSMVADGRDIVMHDDWQSL